MYFSNRNADYVRDVHMEIKSSFFPPPTILIPTSTIPPLRDFKYNFKTEKDMILKYEVERRRREEDELKSKKPLAPINGAEEKPKIELMKPIPVLPLTPSPETALGLTEQKASNGTAAITTTTNAPVKLHGFEEFEMAATVFDLMELRSIDDRRELEKLLN